VNNPAVKMKGLSTKTKRVLGLVAACSLTATGACGVNERPVVGTNQPSVPGTSVRAMPSASGTGSRGSGAATSCAPYKAPAPRTMYPSAVRTAQAGLSPPVSSLPTKEKGPPPATKREIPLKRIRPWAERCPPPPATAPASRSR